VELTPATISLPGVNYRLTAVWSGFPSITTPLFTIQHHFVSLKSGGAYACARDDAAATWCWGDNSSQQMLLSGVTEATFPTRAPALDRFTPLLLGSAAACGVDAGQLFCWANIDYPVLTTPIAIPGGTGLSLYSMDAGENFGCGLKAGSPVCWGVFFNPGSAIGVQPLPGPVGIVYTFLGTASSHSCAISSVNAAYCQGNNPEGQIGDGSIAFRTSLTPVAGGHQFVAIDGGINHTCAITTTGGLYCWGDNRAGELGDLSLGPNSKIPIQVATPVPLTTVHVGFAHGCGVGTDRRAYCWGHGGNGAIGTGADHASNPTVQQVGLPDPVAMVQVGAFHSCALTIRGQVLCWGFNFNGQRGDGGVGDIWLPSPVGVKP
jgi:alpha-tubulin suppressor-like RCC1 family protein